MTDAGEMNVQTTSTTMALTTAPLTAVRTAAIQFLEAKADEANLQRRANVALASLHGTQGAIKKPKNRNHRAGKVVQKKKKAREAAAALQSSPFDTNPTGPSGSVYAQQACIAARGEG